MIDRLGLVVACFVTGVILFAVLQGQHDLGLQVDEIRSRVEKLALDVERADDVGGDALRRHAATPVARAHPTSDSISCPTCPPCG